MSHVVVTGAQGFIGQALVRRLLRDGLGGDRVARLTLLDLHFDAPHADPRVQQRAGSVADAALRASVFADVMADTVAGPVDAVFHLASLPGGAAERDYGAGRRINLDATLQLLEDLRSQARPPRFVYASSVAVHGHPLPARVDEHTLPAPALTYGAHKLACEALVADASRRGWVQGCSLRLPGVVARPGSGAGLMSAFMSRIFWQLAAGEPLTVPVSRDGKAWWISVAACVNNLLHAATVDVSAFNARRCYQMPALHLSVGEVVAALAQRWGADREALVRYEPDALTDRLFASYPPLSTPEAEALGLRHDGDVQALVRDAMA